MKNLLWVVVSVLVCAGVLFAETGVKKRRPLPYEYGQVVLNNYAEKAGMAPVVFDHWFHRSQFTCRVCHVDVGFMMKAGATGIQAAYNMQGYYCGTCHNGKMVYKNRRVFGSCEDRKTARDTSRCDRCHSLGKKVERQYDFRTFTRKYPKERLGNGIDWEKAEAEGIISPMDFIEGISIEKNSLAVQKDFALNPKVEGMPDIIFSHKKHTVWNGCEVCHPEIFIGVKKGKTKYTMIDIYEGKYCGVCHSTVAFPLLDCQRCHTEPVQ